MPTNTLMEQADEAAQYISSRATLRPQVAVVLGSGLGSFADELTASTRIPYREVPHFCRSTAVGHAGQLVIGKLAETPVVVMQGRFHLYEGYTAQQVAFPLRAFHRLAVKAAVLTNAAGGINPEFAEGRLVLIKDHINLQGQNPLVGQDESLGPRFIDMTRAYCKQYGQIAVASGAKLGVNLAEGIYAGLLGPSYETPAEIRFLRTIGADLVGMSTVPEVIAANQMGMKVLAISCVTNMAAGMSDKPINHEEVLETGRRISGEFKALLRDVVPEIAARLQG